MNKAIVGLILFLLCGSARATVVVTDAWARATPPGQEVGAAYMNLKSDRTVSLIAIQTPVAEGVEIHEMSMRNGMMKMRMLESIDLPSGKIVKLAPGGFHLMLFNLKNPLKTGENIEIELSIKDTKGKISKQKVRIPVRAD